MRIILAICATLLVHGAHAIERKSILEVDLNALTTETQAVATDGDSFDFVWWIVPEFWEATFRQSADIPDGQADQILGILRNYSVLAVVQADVSPFGAFRFYDKETVMDGVRVEAIDADGNARVLSHTEPADPDLSLMLDQMRPVMAQAMGNMGENTYFFPLAATDDDGARIASPYERARIRVTLQRGADNPVLEIEMPLDSLFVPRTCPNGKPAHVSWVYCPWSGKKLPK